MSLFSLAADAVLPGSGFLVRLWRWIKPLVPYLLIAVGVLALLLFVDRRAAARENARVVAKYQPRLDRALQAELAGIASIGRLRSSLEQQNASIRTLAAAEAGKLAEAQRALTAARAHDKARGAQIAGLKASAAGTIPGAPCEASQATKEAWR